MGDKVRGIIRDPEIMGRFPSVAYRIRDGYSRRPGGHYIGRPKGAWGGDGGLAELRPTRIQARIRE